MKLRKPFIFTALMMIALLAAACSSGPSAQENYDSFTLIMDKVAGPGNWTAKEHSLKDGALVVNGVTIKFPPKATAAGEAGQAAEAAPSAAVPALDIASVELKNPLEKTALEKVLAAENWRDQKETKLADSLLLKSLSFKVDLPVESSESFDVTVDEIGLTSVTLGAVGAEAPAGRAGFLKALRLNNLGYKNFQIKAVMDTPQGGRTECITLAGLASLEGVSFDGEPLAGLEALDPSGLITVMTAMSAKSATIGGMSFSIKDDRGTQASFSVADVKETDVRPLGAIGSVVMNDFKFDMTGPDMDNLKLVLALKSMSMTGFDMSAYFKKFMPVFIASVQNPEAASEAMAGLQTLADFLVSPFSLTEATLSGLEFKIGELLAVNLAEAKVTGPYQAGEIPLSQKTSMTGLEIVLPANDPGDLDSFRDMYEFAKYFGMNRFELAAEGESTYDPATGLWRKQLSSLSAKDLFDLSGTLEIGGLTTERIAKLKETTLNSIFMVLMSPDTVLGDLAFNGLNLKLTDKGLVNRSFRYAAAREADNPDIDAAAVETFKNQAVAVIELLVGMGGGQYLENPEVLGQSLKAFLSAPGNLEIKAAANPPLGYQAAVAAGGDPNLILNSLNISLSANDAAAPVLKFAIPAAPAPGIYEEDFEIDEEFDLE